MKLWHQLAAHASFETERLLMRPFVYTDAASLFEILGNPENVRFIAPPVTSLADCQALLVDELMQAPLGIWAITDKTGQQGAIRLENINRRQGLAEVGYFLRQAAWGHGLMAEVVTALSQWLLMHTDLTALHLVTHLENTASQRVAEKSGYQLYRHYRGSDRYTKKMRDYKAYRLTLAMFKEGSNP